MGESDDSDESEGVDTGAGDGLRETDRVGDGGQTRGVETGGVREDEDTGRINEEEGHGGGSQG